jgi:hypothetical protein
MPDPTGCCGHEETIARRIREAGERAKKEADARRKAAEAKSHDPLRPREIGGRDGAEPVRYGDWEVKGIASDF